MTKDEIEKAVAHFYEIQESKSPGTGSGRFLMLATFFST